MNVIFMYVYVYECISHFLTESDGSNDSGTSSCGSENKNNPKLRLFNIPFIETIKVQKNIFNFSFKIFNTIVF